MVATAAAVAVSGDSRGIHLVRLRWRPTTWHPLEEKHSHGALLCCLSIERHILLWGSLLCGGRACMLMTADRLCSGLVCLYVSLCVGVHLRITRPAEELHKCFRACVHMSMYAVAAATRTLHR
jgi:hypothetical protein